MKGLSLSAAILVLAFVGCTQAFRGTRQLTKDVECKKFPNTDECHPVDEELLAAVEKSKDEELKELWLNRRKCESIEEEEKCREDNTCLWLELSCKCGYKEIAIHEPECLGFPVAIDQRGQIECPILTAEDECTADERCAWINGICFPKNTELRDPTPIEDLPKICRLFSSPVECVELQDKEACNNTEGRCEWVVADPAAFKDPGETCPAIAEAQKMGLIPPQPIVDTPFGYCAFTQSYHLDIIFQEPKMIKGLRKKETKCRGTC